MKVLQIRLRTTKHNPLDHPLNHYDEIRDQEEYGDPPIDWSLRGVAWIPIGGLPDILFENGWRIEYVRNIDPKHFDVLFEAFAAWVKETYSNDQLDRYIQNSKPNNVFPVY